MNANTFVIIDYNNYKKSRLSQYYMVVNLMMEADNDLSGIC